ncbi:MAG: hypothetical protein K9H16_09055 [Bacteroidales bacterium]|nr:hypothetical protein [Bacteroidales bacterium]
MNQKVKNIVFFLLLALLSLPLFQHFTRIFDTGRLNGDFILHERPQFSWSSWMDGTFQTGCDRFIEDHIGFRNFFVRLNNQIDFSLFDEVNAEGIIKGKNSILYEYDYIRAFTGDDFIGKNTITRKMQKLKFLQEHLKNKFDIDLILIFEPSKARIQPQFIPDSYLEKGKTLSNYEFFKQQADDLKVDCIDLNEYLLEVSDTIPYPVYPPYGIHWSEHTMNFITDSLINYIESKRNIDLPDFKVETKIVGDSISDSDYDAGNTSNLLFRLQGPVMPYPFFTFYDDSTKTRPMVLAVADSYYWNIFNTRVPKNLFANQAFWYFNAKVYPDFYFEEKWTRDLDIQKEVEKQDVILLSITERFLYKFAWQFVDQLYEIYTPEFSGDLIEKREDEIRNYSTWFDDLVIRAQNNDTLTLWELIHTEADFLAQKKDFEIYLSWYGMKYFKGIISSNSNWNSTIYVKANEKGRSYNEQLNIDAAWIFEQNYPELFRKFTTIRKYREMIRADSAWLEAVAQKAQKYYIPPETMVSLDAEYLANKELKPESFEEKVLKLIETIKNDPEWLKAVTSKAAEKGFTLNEMLRRDAEYVITEQQKKRK